MYFDGVDSASLSLSASHLMDPQTEQLPRSFSAFIKQYDGEECDIYRNNKRQTQIKEWEVPFTCSFIYIHMWATPCLYYVFNIWFLSWTQKYRVHLIRTGIGSLSIDISRNSFRGAHRLPSPSVNIYWWSRQNGWMPHKHCCNPRARSNKESGRVIQRGIIKRRRGVVSRRQEWRVRRQMRRSGGRQ